MDCGKEKDHSLNNIHIRPFKSQQVLQPQIHSKVYSLPTDWNMSQPDVAGYQTSISNIAHLLHWHWNLGLLILKDDWRKDSSILEFYDHNRQQSCFQVTKAQSVRLGLTFNLWWRIKNGQRVTFAPNHEHRYWKKNVFANIQEVSC